MTELHGGPEPGGHPGPTMAAAAGPVWEAHPAAGGAAARWGVVHRPTGRWVAFGSEAQCRRVATRLIEADATLPDPGVPLR
jgi:hypothetical protein